jgi:hypothetical protein
LFVSMKSTARGETRWCIHDYGRRHIWNQYPVPATINNSLQLPRRSLPLSLFNLATLLTCHSLSFTIQLPKRHSILHIFFLSTDILYWFDNVLSRPEDGGLHACRTVDSTLYTCDGMKDKLVCHSSTAPKSPGGKHSIQRKPCRPLSSI